MRTLFLLLLALLPSLLPASVKITAVVPVAPGIVAAPPDTAAALHHLFERQRQHRRHVVLGVTGVGERWRPSG